MHELSIAMSVLEIASRHAAGRRVSRVHLRVGRMRQVVPAALTFSFEVAAQGTEAEGAQLFIEDVPAVGRCKACEHTTELIALPLQCECCGGFDLNIVSGEELTVESLELEENERD